MARGQALIVDDSSTARIILARLLRRAELESQGVSTGEQALEYLKRHEAPDVIFLDHLLPGMNGFETLQEIKRDSSTRHIPVFMYTSQSAERYLEEARSLGAAGVISKQVDREQLYSQLASIMETRYAAVGESTSTSATVTPIESYASPQDPTLLRRVTGRLSTLEIAYEEANDELRHLRQALAREKLEREESLQQLRDRYRWAGGLVLAVVVIANLALWSQLDTVSAALENIESQFGLIREILAHLMELNKPR